MSTIHASSTYSERPLPALANQALFCRLFLLGCQQYTPFNIAMPLCGKAFEMSVTRSQTMRDCGL
ncbi:hypothetical protein J6590_069512 [Homalodisca vitripennis]|nr:hypothetical protein J6590_069512 [Homalodisca vitripennis]